MWEVPKQPELAYCGLGVASRRSWDLGESWGLGSLSQRKEEAF